jgi:hypothetical protein
VATKFRTLDDSPDPPEHEVKPRPIRVDQKGRVTWSMKTFARQRPNAQIMGFHNSFSQHGYGFPAAPWISLPR